MHGGFTALRTHCSMGPNPDPHHGRTRPLARADWRGGRRRHASAGRAVAHDARPVRPGGPYLFGDWSVPDAFFTPVATRFRHYQIDLAAHGEDGTAAAYCATLLAQPDFLEVARDGWGGGELRTHHGICTSCLETSLKLSYDLFSEALNGGVRLTSKPVKPRWYKPKHRSFSFGRDKIYAQVEVRRRCRP